MGIIRLRRVTGAALCAAILLAGGLAAGCADDGPSARQWAGSVCGALGPWRTAIADLNAQAQNQMATAATPDQARRNLLELLDGAAAATEQARASIVAAGTPDVAGGDQVAGRFASSLEGARDAYADASAALRALDPKDAKAFYDGLISIFNSLNVEYAKTGVNTAGLDSVELRTAFAEVEQCR